MATGDSKAGIIKIKTEPGLTSAPMKTDRLTSYKLPRDLTLGSLKVNKVARGGGIVGTPTAVPNKKVYVPNLNVTRNKNVDVKTSRDTSTQGRGRSRDRGKNDRGRGRGRGNALIQTTGLFSEGAGSSVVRKSTGGSSYSSGGGGGDGPAQLRRPTINKREIHKFDHENEQKHMNDAIPHDEDDDLDETKFLSQTMPIILSEPLKKFKIKTEQVKVKSEVIVKTENTTFNGVTIKQEKIEQDEIANNESENMGPEVKVKSEFSSDYNGYAHNLNDFFMKKKPQLFLLQLPDTLPGEGPEIEPAESAEFETTTPNPQETFCTIKQLEEGLIGKMVRYKSGRTKLILGETRFDINLGMEPGFLQELISIHTNRTERSGNMINLGEIQTKLNASPDWEYILSKSC